MSMKWLPLTTLLLFQFLALSTQAEQIKIGVPLPLTGGAATYGEDLQNVFRFADEHLGDNRFRLIFEDDMCDGRTAVTIAQRFTRVNRVRGVLGTVCSGAFIPAVPVYENSELVAIGSFTSASILSGIGERIFHTWPLDISAARLLADTIASRHSRLGIISEETEYSQNLLHDIKEAAQGRFEIINENYLPDTSDFRSLLLRLKARDIDALLLNPQSDSGLILLVQQLNAVRMTYPLFAHAHSESNSFLKEAGKLADGMIFTGLPSPEELLSPEGIELYKNYTQQSGKPKSVPHAFPVGIAGYQALTLALLSSDEPAAFLRSHTFSGALRPYSFDDNGEIQGFNYVLKTLRNGEVIKWIASEEGE